MCRSSRAFLPSELSRRTPPIELALAAISARRLAPRGARIVTDLTNSPTTGGRNGREGLIRSAPHPEESKVDVIRTLYLRRKSAWTCLTITCSAPATHCNHRLRQRCLLCLSAHKFYSVHRRQSCKHFVRLPESHQSAEVETHNKQNPHRQSALEPFSTQAQTVAYLAT